MNFVLYGLLIGGSVSCGDTVITVNPAIRYQMMTGWEATTDVGQDSPEFPQFQHLLPQLFDHAVNDLGITRVRLEIRSGAENPRDYWSEWREGKIDYPTWRCVRYSTVNDNSDPFAIKWAGFQFSELDYQIDTVVLPLMRLLASRGERLYINFTYVGFTGQIKCPGLDYNHDDSVEEYAEFVLATYLHVKSKYGWVPDTWEVILEPDNTKFWRGNQIGEAIAAAGKRLKANGFSPRFVAPSNTSMASAVAYIDAMMQVPGAREYVSELSYHRYGGVSRANVEAIGSRGMEYGINTAMLEWIGATYEQLHQDLIVGRNSAWSQYVLAGLGADDGGKYYVVDVMTDPANPQIIVGSRTKFLRQYFRYVRAGAVRMDAVTNNGNFDPVAFVNRDGKHVVIVKARREGVFTIQGLPPGTYGIKYTTEIQYDVDLPEVVITAGQDIRTNIPASGVITVHAKL